MGRGGWQEEGDGGGVGGMGLGGVGMGWGGGGGRVFLIPGESRDTGILVTLKFSNNEKISRMYLKLLH